MYEVRQVSALGHESCPLTIATARWGDISAPFHPTSPPTTQPDGLDIANEVNKFRGSATPKRVFAQLHFAGADPLRRDTDGLDIAHIVVAFRGFKYPFVDHRAGSGITGGPGLCPCEADIRVDSDNDGDIDADDELVEDVSPGVIIYVNDDDDDFDGVADLDEAPVVGENDLAELRLPQDCWPVDPGTAWWSISWPEPDPQNPTLAVWLAPDKSLPATGPLVNGEHRPWPPPESLWIEALSTLEGTSTVAGGASATLAFQVSDDGSGAPKVDEVNVERKPTIKIRLRVVAVVEPLADLDNPRPYTGGCKPRRSDIKAIARQLMSYGNANRIAPGVRFTWNEDAP